MKWLSVGLAAAALAAGPAAAQLILFEHDNFGGRRTELYGPTPDLATSGFNDMVSSVVVERGQWQICENAYYSGRCVTLRPGNYVSLGQFSLNDAISSARPEGGGGGGRPPAGGYRNRVVLYEGFNFTGRSYTFDRDTVNLDNVGFNDRAQSAMVSSGSWTLCEDAEYRGNCHVLGPGNYASLGDLSRRVSSLRQGDFGGASGSSGNYPPSWGGNTRLILYEGYNYGGRQFVVDRNRFDNLDGTGFNDRASSLRVERGYWMLCSDANFNGECRTFGPGNYSSLPPGLNNSISSGRRISDQYPYNQSPVWGTP
jgi:hypothetical protein